jgi:uncharacterized protein (TIGR00730 family)
VVVGGGADGVAAPRLRLQREALGVAVNEYEDARGARLKREYLRAEGRLRAYGVRHTVIVMGSTRASRRNPYYALAREFGHRVGADGRAALTTGGGPGIMEGANRGAFEAGGISIGLNIELPLAQKPNRYLTPGLSFNFRYFALRKLHFMLRARAMVAFPGGYGTLDELFETLTLVQTRKVRPMPVVLVGRKWWQRAIGFDFLAAEGVISRRDATLLRFADTPAEIWRAVAPSLDSPSSASRSRRGPGRARNRSR